MAVRRENASKFSFTRAHMTDDIYGPELIMDNNAAAPRFSPNTLSLSSRDDRITENTHYQNRSRIKNVADDWLEQAELGAHEHFAYNRREKPQTSIDRQIKQYEHVDEKSCDVDGSGSDGNIAPNKRGLEYEIKRPEVFELFKKYYSEGSKVAEDILSNASSENFADDEDEHRKRCDYRQKVESHYKRLMEEGIMIHDPELLPSNRIPGEGDRIKAPPNVSNYQPGITESDWKAIDHHRSLSQEREKDQLSSGGYDSPGLPSALKNSESADKKKKKVRVRRHDSLIKCDSEPDLVNKMRSGDQLLSRAERDLCYTDEAVNDHQDNSVLDEGEHSGRSRLTSRPPSIPGTRSRASTSVPASLRRQHRSSSSSPFTRGASTSSDSSSRQSSPKGSPRRHLQKQDSSDDFFVKFRRREPSESSDRSSRIDPQTYQSYAAGILHSSRKSEPFLRLQKYYATVERITEIEQNTLLNNERCGRRKYNTVNLKVLSKSFDTNGDDRTVEDILLSKYKIENLEELQELYRDLNEAKIREEFFFDTSNLDEIQWSAWRDRGLRSKEVTIQELFNIYERGRASRNTHVVRRKKSKDEIRRELSFKKLFEKYHYLGEEARREKVLEEWWSQRSTSRRGSDASSIMSLSSLQGSYIQIMEQVTKKSKERPMYGYHIDEEPNKYEIHIDNIRRMSKSCPDVSEKSLHVRSESQPEPSGHDKNSANPLTRSASFKQSSFAGSDDKRGRLHRVSPKTSPQSRGSPKNMLEAGDLETIRMTRPASGRSSESGYDSVDGRSPKTTSITPEKSPSEKGRTDIQDLLSDTNHFAAKAQKDIEAYPVQWQSRSLGRESLDSGGENQWRGEIKGVVGKEETRSRDASATGIALTSQPRTAFSEYRPSSIIRESDAYLDDDLKERARRMRIREENFRERQRWRKDSKPNPGAVASALSIFEQNQRSSRDRTAVPNWKMQSKNLPSATAGLQNEVLREEFVSPVHSQRSDVGYKSSSTSQNGNVRGDGRRERHRYSMPPRLDSNFRVDNRDSEISTLNSSPPVHQSLPATSSYTSSYYQVPKANSSSPIKQRSYRRTVAKEVAPDTVTSAKSRLEREMENSKPVPKSALQQRSTKTPLGLYEAKIRSRSEERAPRPKSALAEKITDIDNSSLRRKDLSKSSPSLNEHYVPPYTSDINRISDSEVSTLPRGNSVALSQYDLEDEEPIYASVLKKDQRKDSTDGSRYGAGQESSGTGNRYGQLPRVYHSRFQGDGATTYVQSDMGDTYSSPPSYDTQQRTYTTCRLIDGDTGENQASRCTLNPRTKERYLYKASETESAQKSAFSHVTRPAKMEGRPFALAGHSATTPSREGVMTNDGYSDTTRKYNDLTDFRREIEDEYRKMYDITKKATMVDPQDSFSSFQEVDHLHHSFYGNVGSNQELDSPGMGASRIGSGSQSDLYNDGHSGSNDTLVIIGSDPDLTTGSGKSFSSVKMMKNKYEISRLEKSQSEPNLSQDHLDEGELSFRHNAKSDGEAGGDMARSPDFLDIRAKYESGYVSEDPSPQKEHSGSSIEGRYEPVETRPYQTRPISDPPIQYSSTHHQPAPKSYTEKLSSYTKSSNTNARPSHTKKDLPSPRHPWDIVRSSPPKTYDPEKSMNVLDDLGQEWERDKYKLSQKSKYGDWSRSYPESVLSQDERLPVSSPEQEPHKPITPQNRPPHPPPYVPPPDIKPSQRRVFLNKVENFSNQGPPSNPQSFTPTQSWTPPASHLFQPVNPQGSAHISEYSSVQQEQSIMHIETEPAVQKASELDQAAPPPAKSTASINLNAKSTAKISLSNKTRSKSLSGIEKVPPSPPRNTIRTGTASLKERHGSTSPSPTNRPLHHSASDISNYVTTPGGSTMDRKRRDEEAARRKAQMDRIYMEQKQRRMQEEEAANAARRHNDVYLQDEEYWLRFTGVLEDDKAKPNKLDPNKLDIKILGTGKDRPQQKSPIPPPDQRFEEVDAMSLQRPQKKTGYTPKGKAVALYSFSAQNPKELSFKKGDSLYLLRQIDQNWYEGEHHGRVGIFPSNYIKVITSLETAHAAAFSREGTATAKYNFTAQTSVELPLRKGEVVQLIRRVDDNWYEGRAGNRQGIFPVAYADIVKEPDTPFGTPMSSVAHTPMTGSPGPLSPVSTISNGPAPTIPDAPDSPRSFDLSRSYGFATTSSQSNRSVSPTSSQLSQRQDNNYPRPKSSASNLYGSYNGSSTGTYPHPHHQQQQQQLQHHHLQQHHQQQQQLQHQQDFSLQHKSPPKDMSSYGYRDDAQRPYVMTNGGGSSGTYVGTAGSRDSYSSTSRGYREEEPKYPKYRAIYRYLPQNEDELELNESDVIYVMEKCDDGWFVGLSARTKEFGTFPGNYVQPI